MTDHISLSEAKKFALFQQGLLASSKPMKSTLEVIRKLGYVQIDTISVIERAHNHTLWTRYKGFQSKDLETLQRGRKIFEYWSHAASYLPIEDYRHCLPRMQRYRDGKVHWFNSHSKERKLVLDRIKAEGALSANDFEAPAHHRGGNWFEWKPAKKALEQLFMSGELMVSKRTGFRKVYDLPERVLGVGFFKSLKTPSPQEQGRWLIDRILKAHGIASLREITYMRPAEKSAVKTGLESLLAENKVLPMTIQGREKDLTYVLKETWEHFNLVKDQKLDDNKITLLNPFDNLLIQRKRVQNLFGFNYVIECYTPEPKRKFGYFSLPILWGNRLVGRLDPKADRARKTFMVKSLHTEPGVHLPKGPLDFALEEFAQFNGCEEVEWTF